MPLMKQSYPRERGSEEKKKWGWVRERAKKRGKRLIWARGERGIFITLRDKSLCIYKKRKISVVC